MLNLSEKIILFYILERFIELMVSLRNKQLLKKDYFVQKLNHNESTQMKIFHVCWFTSLLVESHFHQIIYKNIFFYAIIFILILAQTLRWLSILTLKRYWSVDVYDMKEHAIITTGPYAFLKHPNYLAVVLEFFFLPLLLSCYFTLVIGSIANYYILKRRISMEEKALWRQNLYARK